LRGRTCRHRVGSLKPASRTRPSRNWHIFQGFDLPPEPQWWQLGPARGSPPGSPPRFSTVRIRWLEKCPVLLGFSPVAISWRRGRDSHPLLPDARPLTRRASLANPGSEAGKRRAPALHLRRVFPATRRRVRRNAPWQSRERSRPRDRRRDRSHLFAPRCVCRSKFVKPVRIGKVRGFLLRR
jgi:hypothetical protein